MKISTRFRFRSRIQIQGTVGRDPAHLHLQIVPAGLVHGDAAGLGALIGAHNPQLFHLVHDARRAGIAQLDAPLQHGDRAGAHLDHDLRRLGQHLVVFAGRALGGAGLLFRSAVLVLRGLEHIVFDLGVLLRLDVVVLLNEHDDVFALLIGDKGALDTGWFSAADGRIQHVAEADQLLCAALVEDNAAFERG